MKYTEAYISLLYNTNTNTDLEQVCGKQPLKYRLQKVFSEI